MTIKIPREQTEFVTPEGLLSFLFLFPGQAQDSFRPGSKAYKIEIGCDLKGDDQIVKAVSTVAQAYDPANWQKHVSGPTGRLKRLEETNRDVTKYPYYAGKYVLTFSSTFTPDALGMKGANLADPADRAKFDQALAAKAPGARRFANPQLDSDRARIEQMNLERRASGLIPYAEADYHKVLLPLMAHEIWAGCFGRISGRAYWNANAKPATVHLALEHVLLTRTGDRIVGEHSPDAAFGEFAPSAELAPPGAAFGGFQPPQQNLGGFGSLL